MKKKKKVAMAQQSYPSNKDIAQVITHLLVQQFNFVLFRYPLSKMIHLIVAGIGEGNSNFVLHSFDSTKQANVRGQIFDNIDILKVLEVENAKKTETLPVSSTSYMSQEDYQKYVEKIVATIKQTTLTKCVAARKKRIDLPSHFNPANTFVRLLNKYTETFSYIANTSLGLWMGATPELLLHKKETNYYTVALAGTKLVTENREWTEKEKDEQAIVSTYIVDSLKNEGITSIETSPVFEAKAGQLLHLKTDIHFQANKSYHKLLHPTPAVCGMPVDLAKAFILQEEGVSRSLYSGFLGLDGEQTQLYVNLRCMQLFSTHIDIHIGAGITANSNPEEEWFETENKANTMQSLLVAKS